MPQKFKPHFSVFGLLGAIFAPLGLLFFLIGAVVALLLRTHPEQFSVEGNAAVFQWTFGGIGLLFLLLGLGFLYSAFAKVRMQKRIYEAGHSVLADFVGVTQEMNVSINGIHPFLAELHYTDECSVLHIYRSRRLLFDPTPYLTGRQVQVYVDPQNLDRYYADIDSVLPQTQIHGA